MILFLLLRARYPRWVLWGACALLFVANTFTAGADLAGVELIAANTLGVLTAAIMSAAGFCLLWWWLTSKGD